MLAPLVAGLAISSSPLRSNAAYSKLEGFDASAMVARAGQMGITEIAHPGFPWSEVIVSWNADSPKAAVDLRLQLEPKPLDRSGFQLANWAPGAATSSSGKNQKQTAGVLKIDTLQLFRPASGVSLSTGAGALKFVTFCFSDRNAPLPPLSKVPEMAPLAVPELFQCSYPNGQNICSPTAVTMILNYWSVKRNRSDLAVNVPTVAAGVHDANCGEGNWAFNTAYAGSFPGMRAYVTRLTDSSELREWLAAGVPVACSGSHYLLQGRERPKGDRGHIFVVVGFTNAGDVIVNDPGRHQVRQVYKLKNFEKAWDTSGRTVYLIYPEAMKAPEDRLGHWFSG